MTKTAFATTHSAMDFGTLAQRLSRLFVPLAGLRSGARADTVPVMLTQAKGSLHYVTDPYGRLVTCTSGMIWVTFDGEARDVVLKAGESFRCDSHSRLGISAFEAATVRLV